jgi:hypothetical protein
MLALLLFALGSLAEMALARSGDDAKAREQWQSVQRAAPRPVIELRGDLLSVKVRNAPWEVVMKELERQTGIAIQLEGRMPGVLTQEFASLPLEQGLRHLFREVNTVFFYAPGTQKGRGEEKLIRVWLLPRERSGAGERQVSSLPSRAVAGVTQEEFAALMQSAEVISSEEGTQPEEVSGTEVVVRDEEPPSEVVILGQEGGDAEHGQ